MTMAIVGAALIAAGGTIYAAEKASDAQDSAINSAERQTLAGIALQNASTGRQLELARPLIETRDNALRALQTLFGLPQSAPSDPLGASGRGSNGSRLVALNGLSTTGQHSAQTSRSTVSSILDPPGLSPGGPLARKKTGGGAGASPSLFYDPGSNTIVDGNGQLVFNVPEGGGVIEGLLHGYNNAVSVDTNGNLTSIGSNGSSPINIRLQRQTPEQAQEFVGGSATNPSADRTTLIDTLMQTPGIQFVDQQGRKELEQMLAARGLRRSGPGYAAGIKRASDLASTNYSNLVLNPLFQLAGFGQQGANQASGALAQQGQNATANSQTLANLALQAGNARASSYQQTGQTIGDLASNLAFIYDRNGGFGQVPKTGTLTTNKQPSSVSPLAAAVTTTPGYLYNDPLNNPYYGGN